MNSLSEHIRSLSRSSTTLQTLIDIADDVQELEAENARLLDALKEVAELMPNCIGKRRMRIMWNGGSDGEWMFFVICVVTLTSFGVWKIVEILIWLVNNINISIA